MRKYWAMAAFVFLAGCGIWSPVIRSDVIDYGDVVETTSDKFLLVNILEARDNAPLHFMEFPKVSGSLTATASLQSAIPFSPESVGTAGSGIIDPTLTPNIGVTASPTFEVDNVDTTDFTNGISSPVAPQFVKYWIDRGIDKRIILLMFFSSVTITEKLDIPESCKTDKKKQFQADACAFDVRLQKFERIASCKEFAEGGIADPAQCIGDLGSEEIAVPSYCGLDPNQVVTDRKQCSSQMSKMLKVCNRYDKENYNHDTCDGLLAKNKTPTPESCGPRTKHPDQCATDLGKREPSWTITLFNSPRETADVLASCVSLAKKAPCHAITPFELYLKLINEIHGRFSANIYSEKSLLAKDVKIDNSDVPNYDPTQYELEGVAPALPDQRTSQGKHAGSGSRSSHRPEQQHASSPSRSRPPGSGVFNIYNVPSDKKVALCFGTDSAAGKPTDKKGNICVDSTIVDLLSSDKDANDETDTTDAALIDKSPSGPSQVADDLIPHKKGRTAAADAAASMPCEDGALDESVSAGNEPARPSNQSQFCRVFWNYYVAHEKRYDCDKIAKKDCSNTLEGFSLGLTTRSPAEMVRFVGDLVYYQDILGKAEHDAKACDPDHNFPLTLGWGGANKCPSSDATETKAQSDDITCAASTDIWKANSEGCLFRIVDKNTDTRFHVDYKGKTYGIADSNPYDHSLEVLSILTQVINLNKKASDLRITPIIQVVP